MLATCISWQIAANFLQFFYCTPAISIYIHGVGACDSHEPKGHEGLGHEVKGATVIEPDRARTYARTLLQNMWGELVPSIDHRSGLVVSVSSVLIMLVLHPLVKNAVAASRGICAMARGAAASLLPHDGGVAAAGDRGDRAIEVATAPPRRHCCQRCARDGAPSSSRWDVVVAAMARLGLAAGGSAELAVDGGDDDDEVCRGCAAMAAVEELLESKVAGEGELREAFGVFDGDGDGFVGAAELWDVMRRLGLREGAAFEDCQRMIAAFDGDGDGRVSFREFRAMMENAV
ncbi:hypothetical protein ACP4OV_008423 [Aristida adscensionis]